MAENGGDYHFNCLVDRLSKYSATVRGSGEQRWWLCCRRDGQLDLISVRSWGKSVVSGDFVTAVLELLCGVYINIWCCQGGKMHL